MDWTSLKTNLQSSTIPADAWEAIWMAFTNQVGSTWGDYVTMLDNNAAYLGGLGIKVNDVGTLVGFQLMLADGLSPLRTLAKSMDASVPTPGPSLTFSRFFGEPISQRCALGPFGRGWSHNWQYSLQRRSDGTITVVGPANSQRTFLPDTRSGYFIEAGDTGTLAAGSAGSFTLTEKTGFLYSYGSDGKLQYVQDLNRKTIRLSYTGNQLTSLTHSSGQTIQIAYNAAGLIETVTDNLGRQTVLSYDGVNEHLVGAQYSDGRTATYTYNTTGALAQLHELTAIATSCCNWRYFTYDQQGRLTATYLQGHTEATTYDYGPGGLVTVTDALGNPTQLFYDYRGTLLKTVDPNTNSLSRVLDQNDNLVSVIDDAGRSYTYSYDSNGNVARSLDAAGNSTQFSFSTAFNRLASLTDAKGNVTRYAYDPYGHVQSTTFADGSLESWTYDADGNRQTWINRRGHQTFYTWNNSGLMTGKYFADGSAAEYNYDSRGNLTNATTYDSMLTPLESVGMTYDGSNHLVRMDYPEGRYLAFEYDAAGRRTSSVDQLGHRLNYSYDVAGRPQGITNELNGLVVVCQYDAAGRTITRTLGNGIHTTYDYDRIGQLLNLTNYFSNGTMISRFNYTYDARGRRATMSTVDGNWNYSYDDLGQLSHAVYDAATTNIPNQNLTYVYDSLGNRNLTIENGVTNSYSVNSLNQYQSVGATNYTFDADGNLIKVSSPQGTTLFSYNDENRLLEITSLQGTWTYTYDGFGNRVATEVDGTARRYVIDPLGLGNVVSEYDRHCNLIAHYDHGMGNEGLVSRSDAGNTQTVFTFDAIGNVREIVAPSGSIDNAYAYSPFGLLVSKKEAFQNSFKFVGRSGVMDDGSARYVLVENSLYATA